jgi:Tol biopolymer transport system component
MNADGSKVRRLTDNPALDSEAQFSLTAGKSFVSDRSGTIAVYVMAADGGAARQLTADELGGLQPDWSPDGEQIAVINNCCVAKNSDMMVMNSNGKDVRPLTQSFDNNLDPSWSPTGRRSPSTTPRRDLPRSST